MNDSINRNAPISHRARKAQRCVHEFTIHNGFSLIELMIVLVIVAILASIGSAYYGNYVISANRTEARSALTITAGRLEKCKALYGSYNNANCSVTLPFNTETSLYTVAGATLTNTTFTLQATPVAGKAQAKDSECTQLTISHTSATSATGSNPDACW